MNYVFFQFHSFNYQSSINSLQILCLACVANYEWNLMNSMQPVFKDIVFKSDFNVKWVDLSCVMNSICQRWRQNKNIQNECRGSANLSLGNNITSIGLHYLVTDIKTTLWRKKRTRYCSMIAVCQILFFSIFKWIWLETRNIL